MATTELTSLTLRAASDLVHRRAISPVDLADAYLARIDRLNPQLNAYLTVTAEQARSEARQAEIELGAGTDRGPLHGIPIGLKDLIATAGVRTTAGSKILADWVPTADATVVRRLRTAGAVLLGKCALTEFATGSTDNPHYGPTRNPWNPDCVPGGSSSGPGVAVAAELCAAALGSDTATSIRQPAAYCGIVGLRPTYGRVSLAGAVPLSWSFDTIGPMARTVEDTALLLAAIAGDDPDDASTVPAPVDDYRARLTAGLQGIRVGVPRNYFWERSDSEVAGAVESALGVLRDLAAEVEDLDLPGLEQAIEARSIVHSVDAHTYHAQWLGDRPDDYGADVRERVQREAGASAGRYVEAQQTLARFRARVRGLPYDVLATPTTPTGAPRFDQTHVMVNGRPELARALGLTLTTPFTATLQPTLSVPCGFTTDGLPIGLQIAGRHFDEATVLRVGHAYEQATEWHTRRPKL